MIFTKAKKVEDHYVCELKGGGVSLGEFVFLANESTLDTRMLSHEIGHRKQSRILGWLYLPVIGLPSVIWAVCFKRYRIRNNVGYYSFYTESWADRLGGVR